MVIRTKIVTAIGLTILLTVGLATFVVLHVQNKRMIDAKIEDVAFLGDVIERTIEHEMKEGHNGQVQEILENIGKNKEILNLRILSPEGTILRSTSSREMGTTAQDYTGSSSQAPSQKAAILNGTTINYFRNILNRKECYGCHSNKDRVNGIIQIKLDISRSLFTILSVKRLFIFSIVLIVLLVSGILSMLFSRLVMSPLRNLLSAIHDVESGNWNATVKIESNDELAFIGSSFNKMIVEINKLHRKDIHKERELANIRLALEHQTKHEELNAQLEFKVRELEAANRAITSLSKEVKGKNMDLEKAVESLKKINEISRILSSIVDSEELLKIMPRTTADLLNTEKAVLHVSKNTPATLQYLKGNGVESLETFPYPLDAHFSDLLASGKPLFVPQAADGQHLASQIGVPLKMKTEVIGAMIVDAKVDGTCFTKEDLALLATLSHHAVVAIENAWLYKSVQNNYIATIQSLVNALEASDKFTKGHSERVRFLSLELGRHIGLDVKELEVLEQAAILHDIGKIGIESFILQKQGKLTANEYSMIKAHPLIGEEILGPIDTLGEVRRTILQHHERHDGKGYPYGLQGDELSLKAKILSVADTFDAMMSDRPYRKALSLQQIRQEVEDHSGTQFDPHMVEAFMELLELRGEDILSSAGYDTFRLMSRG